MAAKKNAQRPTPSAPTQPELIEQLCAAGHTLDGFTRKGINLILRLSPTDLVNDAGGFVALDICDAANLQARCHIYAAIPHDLLILTVLMPGEADNQPSAKRQAPSASVEPEGSAE